MKLVEGHLEMLRMFRDLSSVSHSTASNLFRDYIDMLDRAVANGFGDILPRTVKVTPMVDQDGKANTKWITPEADAGRIVSKSS